MRTNFAIPLCSGMLLVTLFSSCAGTRDATALRDGVYDKPATGVLVSAVPSRSNPQQAEDDYYNAGESNQQRTARGYYDMAYNDPYYYNYGRFGFGMGVGMGTWGRGGGWGWGMGYGNGWHDPFWGDPWYGYGGWDPYWNGYYYPYWSGFYGPGPYYGPYGNCWGCYMPVVIGEGAHRTRMGHRGSLSNGNGTSRSMVTPYDPVGLRQSPGMQRSSRNGAANRPDLVTRPGQQTREHSLGTRPAMRDRPSMERDRGGRGGMERSSPSLGTSPSRSSGGSFGGGSMGGTRPSGGRR